MSKKIIVIDRKDFFFGTFMFPLLALIIKLIFAFFQNKFEKNDLKEVLLDICAPILIYMFIINIVIFFKCSKKSNKR